MFGLKADIVCIQATHKTCSEDVQLERYGYISTATQTSGHGKRERNRGRVAVMIRNEWGRQHRSNRTLLKPDRGNRPTDRDTGETVTFSTHTHLAHAMEMANDERTGSRSKRPSAKYPKRDLLVRVADNTGQIARKNATQQENPQKHKLQRRSEMALR